MRKLMQVLVLLLVPPALLAATIHVPSDQPTIQAGIDAAAVHDTVLVAKGIYTGDGNRDVDFGGKSLVLLSVDGPDSTMIDCAGVPGTCHSAFSFHSGEDSSCVIDGFTVRNGCSGTGGAIYIGGESSPTIRNCAFRSNQASANGGAVELDNGSAVFEHCVFDSNSQTSGLGCEDFGFGGGAIHAYEYYSYHVRLALTDCVFTDNYSTCGEGAVMMYDGSLTMTDCQVVRNSGGGCGLFCVGRGAVSVIGNSTIERTVFADNEGVPVGMGNMSLVNCTIVNNEMGIYCLGQNWHLTKCIIAFSGDQSIVCDWGSAAEVTCCNFYGNTGGDWMECIADQFGSNGNISVDPMFCDPANGDYSIDSLSPCAPSYNVCGQLIGALEPKCSNYESVCGDVDASGETDIDDIVYLINFVFAGGPSPIPLESGNVDCVGIPDIDDIVYLITYVFASGPAPCAECM